MNIYVVKTRIATFIECNKRKINFSLKTRRSKKYEKNKKSMKFFGI